MKLGNLTMGTKMMLGPVFAGLLPADPEDATEAHSHVSPTSLWKPFNEIADPQEILHSLRLLRFILKNPACKQAFLQLLRES